MVRQLSLFAGFVVASVAFSDAPRAQDGDLFRLNVTVHDRTKAYRGFNTEITDTETVNAGSNPKFRIFGNGGAVLRTWQNPLPNWAFAELVKPLSYGRILALIFDRATAGLGPRDKMLVELDWNGNIVWRFDARPLGFQLHHDFERLSNGNTLVIAQKTRVVPSISPAPLLDDVIWEVDPLGNIVWDWASSAHIAQLFNATELGHVASLSSQAVANGTSLSIFHMNSIQTLPANPWEATDPRFREGNLLVSLRDSNLSFIIDRTTKAVVWKYQGTIAQHHPRMIPAGLQGAGNILIFDNGGTGGFPPVARPYSRVIEVNPVTMSTVWEYSCTEAEIAAGTCKKSFYSKVMGGAERLPNGNTLITEATSGRAFEVTSADEKVWEYIGKNRTYRTYRIDWTWRNLGAMPKFIW